MGAFTPGEVVIEPTVAGSAPVVRYQPTSPSRGSGDASRRPCLVLAPGAGAGQHHPFMRGLATAIASLGIDVVTFDFPYRQAGRRAPDRPAVLLDCFRTMVAWVRTEVCSDPGAPVFAGGKSMGGRIASHLATDAANRLAGVVAVGYPLRPPGGSGRDRTSHLSALVCPLLVLQGTRDAFGGPREVEVATRNVPMTATVVAIEGADHGFAVRGTAPGAVLDLLAAHIANWMIPSTR